MIFPPCKSDSDLTLHGRKEKTKLNLYVHHVARKREKIFQDDRLNSQPALEQQSLHNFPSFTWSTGQLRADFRESTGQQTKTILLPLCHQPLGRLGT
jgi:hypothetical protein